MATNLQYEVDVQDVEYQRLDGKPWLTRVYRPKGPGPFPTTIDVHGGAWRNGDRTNNRGICQALAERGVVVAALDFRQPPEASYPASLQDINLAIRWLKAHAAGFNGSTRVGAWGNSSGGHLIALSGIRPRDARYAALPLPGHPEIDASLSYVIAGWPVIDPLYRYQHVALAKNKRLTLEQFNKKMQAGEVKELPLILKADVNGSAEVLSDTMQSLSTDKVRVNVLRSGVGAITESDVDLASASDAIIIGFNVKPERNAAALADREKVDVRLHSIIYNLTDEIKKAMAGLLSPVFREIYKGKAEVKATFRVSKVGNVAGCQVLDGNITRDCSARIMREGVAVHTGRIISLRRFKDDVSEVRSGMECGITVDYNDVKVGDVIEAFLSERVLTETI